MYTFDNLLSRIFIRILSFENQHKNVQKLGISHNHVGLILKGQARFYNKYCDFTLTEGDMVFIPKGAVYTSEWNGSPKIQFYSLGFAFQNFDLNGVYALQKIPASEILKRDIENIYQLTSKPHLALSAFYLFYEKISEQLVPNIKSAVKPSVYPALTYMQTHYLEPIKVETLAKLCHISEPYFYATFKSEMDCTPIQYKNMIKCERAVEMLLYNDCTLDFICEQLNFSSPAFLRRQLKLFTGKTPRELREEYISL